MLRITKGGRDEGKEGGKEGWREGGGEVGSEEEIETETHRQTDRQTSLNNTGNTAKTRPQQGFLDSQKSKAGLPLLLNIIFDISW